MRPPTRRRILIIDDEVSVCRFIRHSLEAHQFEVEIAHSGADGIQRSIEFKPDLILLDHGLSDISGLQVLIRLREWSKVPVIFLTVRDAEEDKVAALDQGADDYITKPFGVPELLARIRVAFRRTQEDSEAPLFKTGSLAINRSSHQVMVEEREIKLTATEYGLLCLLARHAGKIVPHRTILKEIWGPNSVEHGHYLRVYFSQLRKKLDAAQPGVGSLIENAAGVGYRLKMVNP